MAITLDNLKSVKWARTNLWEIQFISSNGPSVPAQFSSWFPASNVKQNLWTLNHETFNIGNTTVSIPLNTTEFTVEVTFFDDVTLSVHNWMTDWVNNTILKSYGTQTLDKVGNTINIKKLSPDRRTPVSELSFLVYPRGSFEWTGDSEPAPLTNSVEFAIIGPGVQSRIDGVSSAFTSNR